MEVVKQINQACKRQPFLWSLFLVEMSMDLLYQTLKQVRVVDLHQPGQNIHSWSPA